MNMTNNKAPKKPIGKDWHPADLVAALHKRGVSFAQLAFANGYKSRACLTHALRKPYPTAEAIIARELGLRPEQIWPSRYNTDGTSNRIKGRRPMLPATLTRAKDNTSPKSCNPQSAKAA